ncbi:MAG: hypothetical protein EBW37_10405 [Rhodobacteraceae bacterium]|nr:hypothetical protein [Paracoccaceae bacterium]
MQAGFLLKRRRIWTTGAVVSFSGLVGLIWCIIKARQAKNAASSDEELNAAIRTLIPWNMGALFLSTTGLMIVIVGIFLQ